MNLTYLPSDKIPTLKDCVVKLGSDDFKIKGAKLLENGKVHLSIFAKGPMFYDSIEDFHDQFCANATVLKNPNGEIKEKAITRANPKSLPLKVSIEKAVAKTRKSEMVTIPSNEPEYQPIRSKIQLKTFEKATPALLTGILLDRIKAVNNAKDQGELSQAVAKSTEVNKTVKSIVDLAKTEISLYR